MYIYRYLFNALHGIWQSMSHSFVLHAMLAKVDKINCIIMILNSM